MLRIDHSNSFIFLPILSNSDLLVDLRLNENFVTFYVSVYTRMQIITKPWVHSGEGEPKMRFFVIFF